MEIKILELTDTSAKFILSDASPEIANSLRRCLIAEIPKMAIDTVEFHLGEIQGSGEEENEEYESVSSLFDEIIAHRLGLVPIPSDPELYVEAKRLITQAREAVEDAREAAPISSFSSILFGAVQ